MINSKFHFFFKSKPIFRLTIALIIILMILLQILCEFTLKYSTLYCDISYSKAFSLTKPTKSFLSGIDKNIEIFVLNNRSNFIEQDYSHVNIDAILSEYPKYNNNINLDYIEIENASQNLIIDNLNDLNENNVIIKYNNDYIIYDSDDFIYQKNKNTIISTVEQQITSGIYSLLYGRKNINIISENNKKINSLHIINMLKTNGFNVQNFSNLKEGIQNSPDILIIFSPLFDFTQDDISLISEFLENGQQNGKTLVYIPNHSINFETPNLNSFLNTWGINIDSGIVYDTNHIYQDNLGEFFIEAQYVDNNVINILFDKNKPVVMPSSRPMSIIKNTNKNVTEILKFSSESGIWTTDEQRENLYIPLANIPAILISEDKNKSNLSKIITISSSTSFFKERLFDEESSNYIFYLSLFNQISGKNDSPIIGLEEIVDYNELHIQKEYIFLILIIGVVILLIIWGIYLLIIINNKRKH